MVRPCREICLSNYSMNIDASLQRSFPADLCALLVRAVKEAFEANLDYHNPEIGHNHMTFGLCVYHSKVLFLSKLAESDRRITILRTAPFFEMKIGEFRVSTFSATANGNEECFPGNQTRAPLLTRNNKKQLSLPFSNLEEIAPVNVFLSHVGNPDTGLERILLGVPVGVAPTNRVDTWETTVDLWTKDESELVTVTSIKQPLAPAEKVSAPVITLRPDSDKATQKN